MTRLSWRKQPDERGLASIGQSPRGLELRYGNENIADVLPVTKGNRWNVVAWYFCASADEFGVPHRNTYGAKHYKTKELAKAACDAYVKEHFVRLQ